MSNHHYLFRQALKYVEFKIGNAQLSVPYMINDGSRCCSSKTRGKGTPEQIRIEIEEVAKKTGIDLTTKNSKEINQFMKNWGIGIDCSGLVFNLMESWLAERYNVDLGNELKRLNGLIGSIEKWIFQKNRVNKIGAELLLSELNTYEVQNIKDIRVGDFISTTPLDWPTKHILLIVDVTPSMITYVQSSDDYIDERGKHHGDLKLSGAHFGHINIVDQNAGLEKQAWDELTKSGDNFGKKCYLPDKGDTVKRLAFLKSL